MKLDFYINSYVGFLLDLSHSLHGRLIIMLLTYGTKSHALHTKSKHNLRDQLIRTLLIPNVRDQIEI
jgi:hypothetical protein